MLVLYNKVGPGRKRLTPDTITNAEGFYSITFLLQGYAPTILVLYNYLAGLPFTNS